MSTATASSPVGRVKPSRPPTVLGLDYGSRRIGVATGNGVTGTAQPLVTIDARGDGRWQALSSLIRQWQPAALVVGVPRHPDGAAHENTTHAQRFSRQLQGRYRLPVHEVDERYTTVAALSEGAPDADAAAACLIVEQFFREHP